MKHPAFSEQAHKNARAFALFDLRAERDQQCFHVTPRNIAGDRSSEDRFQGMLVPALHGANDIMIQYHK